MGPKKKAQSHTEKQIKPSLTSSNKIRTVRTNDGGNFQISDALLSKFSGKLRRKVQQLKSEDQVLEIDDVDKVTFKYIEEFLSSRKDKESIQIHFPIRSNISLSHIMEQSDAILMQKIQNQGGMELVHRLLDAATSLQIEDIRKRLFCLVALKLSKHTVDELKQIYDIPNIQANQDVLKTQMKSHLQDLKKNEKKIEEQ